MNSISTILLSKITNAVLILFLANALAACQALPSGVEVRGEFKRWHPLTFTVDGPNANERGNPNPFLDYRLTLMFTHSASGATVTVPGYFAADGNAGETGATKGNKWRAHFTPYETGRWEFTYEFRSGEGVAINLDPVAGTPVPINHVAGGFEIRETDKSGRDHRGKGMLRYVGERYLRFDDGAYFVKGGADSPENLLAYGDFDDTFSLLEKMGKDRDGEAPTSPLHHYKPHLKDWNEGDPTWKGGKGKGLIGALNYLAGKGLNAFSFLTMNVEGDGQDVWPWTAPDVHDRFDVSKLDQWEVLFKHADSLGLYLHFKTQETENDLLLDNGDLGPERKLYYRELIARFAHHHASNWNLGEENDIWEERQDPSQERIKAYIEYIHALDPYDHPVVIHTYPGQYEQVYRPLLGDASELDGLSIQTHFDNVHEETLKWIEESAATSRAWVVANDEQGPHTAGVKPDGPDSNQNEIRKLTLWGNLMAGGAGVEYYFGYKFPPHDLNTNDWRSRDLVWDDVNHALTFFYNHIPFWEMQANNGLVQGASAYTFAKPGEIYAVYLLEGGNARLRVDAGSYEVHWFNPRAGGDLQKGSVTTVQGPGMVDLGNPPGSPGKDWTVLIRKGS